MSDFVSIFASGFGRQAILNPTPEQVAEEAERQRADAERLLPLVTDSLALVQYKNALGAEQSARETIHQAFEMLAESWFWQGRFGEAAIGTDDPLKTAEYREYEDAHRNLDAPLCLCGPQQVPAPGSAKGTILPARREVQRVYVAYDGKEVKFIRCDVCKKLFAQTV